MSSTENAAETALQTIRNYIEGFNQRDAEAMAATFNFPHVRLARGHFVTIADAQAFTDAQARVTALLREEGWDHTSIERLEVVQCGEQKVHVAVTFTRRKADGTPVHRFDSLWIVTLLDGHWGVQFRSSYLLSEASTLGPD